MRVATGGTRVDLLLRDSLLMNRAQLIGAFQRMPVISPSKCLSFFRRSGALTHVWGGDTPASSPARTVDDEQAECHSHCATPSLCPKKAGTGPRAW